MLVRRSPIVAELRAIQQELTSLLDRVFGSEMPGVGGFVPALDMYFQDGHCGERKAPEVPWTR